MNPEFVTLKQAAQILQCSLPTLRKAIKQGRIESVSISPRVTRILKSQLENFIGSKE